MICKERDAIEHPENDRFSKAGAKAEKQMAFYLKREFATDDLIVVFNDLRLVDEMGDACQIDHLVLHQHGFMIVESKSVSSKVKVNEHGEWSRLWGSRWKGMASPLQQGALQGALLRKIIAAHAQTMVGKNLLGKQIRFVNTPIEVLVAVSDHGEIHREGFEDPNVLKADQVPARIRDIIRRHKKTRAIFNFSKEALDLKNMDGVYNFKEQEMESISGFLVSQHTPATVPSASTYPTAVPQRQAVAENTVHYDAATPPPLPKELPPPAPDADAGMGLCKSCDVQCMIKWGRYGYYWKCLQCDANMPIKEFCPSCKTKQKLRTDKQRFFIRCEPCETERLYCEFE